MALPRANQCATEAHVRLPFEYCSETSLSRVPVVHNIIVLVIRLLLRDLAQPCLFDAEVADAEHVFCPRPRPTESRPSIRLSRLIQSWIISYRQHL
jgi:hypothetical protein